MQKDVLSGVAAVIFATFGVGLAIGIGFPLTSVVFERWGQPNWMIGIASAAPAVAILLFMPFVPAVIRVLGPAAAMLAGCSVASACFLILAGVQTPWLWIALRFVMGVALSLPWLIGETWINTAVRDDSRGRVIAIYAISFFSGMAAGPFLLKLLGAASDMLFFVGGLAIALAGLPMLAVLRFNHSVIKPSVGHPLKFIRLFPIAMIGGFVGGFCEMVYFSFLPNVAIASGLKAAEAMTLLSVMTLGGIVLQFPIGWLADRLPRVRVLTGLLLVFLVLILLLPQALALAGQTALLHAFAIGGVVMGFYSLGLMLIGQWVAKDQLASANAAFLSMYQFGGIFGPVATGIWMSWMPVYGFVGTSFTVLFVTLLYIGWHTARQRQ